MQNQVLKSFSSLQSHNLLIIHCDAERQLNGETIHQLYSQLLQALKNRGFKKIIFITSPKDDALMSSLLNSGIGCRKLIDQTVFGTLTELSQLNLLKKDVTFQGKNVPLNHLINIHSANKIVGEHLLIMLIENREIKLGSAGKELMSPYINRTLSRKSIRLNILHDEHFLFSNIILLAFDTKKDSVELEVNQKFVFKLEETDCVQGGIVFYYGGGTCSEVFETLHTKHPKTNIFWTQYQHHWLILERFYGDINILQEYTYENMEFDYLNEELFFKPKEFDEKYIILAGDPGMGKSAFLQNLSNNLKKNNATLWVIQISLNHLSSHKRSSGFKSLDDITFLASDTEKANNFVLDIVSPDYCENLERELLSLALNESSPICMFPKIVILVDGFDEICPIYREKTLTFLNALRKSNVSQIWVTTRTHEQPILERELGVSAYSLNVFTTGQKYHFIKRIFFTHNNTYDVPDQTSLLCEYLADISFDSGPRDRYKGNIVLGVDASVIHLEKLLESNFTDNPLHCRMLAEVVSKNRNILLPDLDLLRIYTEFADMKFSKYYNEKTNLMNSVAANEMMIRDMSSLKHIHGTLAINEIYPDSDNIISNNIDTSELIRVGFLIECGSGVSFVHRSFAEYFASQHIAENFADSRVQNILSGNFFWDGVSKVVRTFLDKNLNFLLKLENTNHSIFEDICVKNKKSRWLLVTALQKENRHILKAVLKHVRSNTEQLQVLKLELLKDSNFTKRTDKGRKVLSLVDIILYDNDIFDHLYNDIINRMTLPTHFCSYTILHKWICCYTGTNINLVLDRIFEKELDGSGFKANDLLTYLQEILFKTYDGLTILHIATIEENLNLIHRLFLWIKQKIRSYQCAEHTQNELKVIDSKIYELLFKVDHDKRTFLHVLEKSKNVYDFLTFLYELYGKNSVLNLIMQGDSTGQTLFHCIVRKDRECALTMDTILILSEIYLDVKDLRNIIFTVDELQQTSLHRQAYVSEKNTSFETLLTYIISIFDSRVVAELFQIKDICGKTVMHHVLCSNKVLTKILCYFKKTFKKKTLKTLICSRDNNNQNLVHSVVHQNVNSQKTLLTLMQFIKNHLGKHILKGMLLEKDADGRTVFHYACEENSETIDNLLCYTKNEFGLKFIKLFITMKDRIGRTGLHYSAINNVQSGMPIKTVLTFLKSNYDDMFFHEVVFKRDSGGRTVIHLVQEGIEDYRLETLIHCLEESCEEIVILKSLLELDKDGKSPLDIRPVQYSRKFLQQTYISLLNALPKFIQNIHKTSTDRRLTFDEVSLLFYQIHYLFDGDDMFNILSKILDNYSTQPPLL